MFFIFFCNTDRRYKRDKNRNMLEFSCDTDVAQYKCFSAWVENET